MVRRSCRRSSWALYSLDSSQGVLPDSTGIVAPVRECQDSGRVVVARSQRLAVVPELPQSHLDTLGRQIGQPGRCYPVVNEAVARASSAAAEFAGSISVRVAPRKIATTRRTRATDSSTCPSVRPLSIKCDE